MDIEVFLQGTELAIWELLPQSGKELAELLCIHALFKRHVKVNSLADRDCKDDGDRLDLVHPIVYFEGTVL